MLGNIADLNISCQAVLYHRTIASLYTSAMTIGSRVLELRKHLELSGDKFGEICGVTRGAVSQWEHDLTKPTTENLIKLREKHYFSIDWVLTGEGTMVPSGLYDPRIAAIANTLRLAMQEGKEYLIENTQKNLDASTELAAQATALAKKNDC